MAASFTFNRNIQCRTFALGCLLFVWPAAGTDEMDDFLSGLVLDGELVGVSALVSLRGKVIYRGTFGLLDY
jgi:hypothetical protein